MKDGTIKSLTQIAILSLLMDNDNYVARLAEILPLNSQTLYSAMKVMDQKKLVSSYWQEGDIGGRRHMYSITGAGREYYEENKVEIDYKLLAMEHDKAKMEKQEQQQVIVPPPPPPPAPEKQLVDKKIYIPVDFGENAHKADNKNAVSLPLTKAPKAEEKPAPGFQQNIFNVYVLPDGKTEQKTDAPQLPEPKEEPKPAMPTPMQEYAKPRPTTGTGSRISPYISPLDPIITTPKKPQQTEIKLSGTVAVDLQPLLRPNSVKADCGFVLANRLRFFAGIATAVLLAIAFVVMTFMDKTPTIYTIAFEVLAVYLAFTLAVWLVMPNTKKKLNLGKLFSIRFGISIVAVIVVWAVYLLVNATTNPIWGIVPSMLCAAPLIEGIIIIAFRKMRGFTC